MGGKAIDFGGGRGLGFCVGQVAKSERLCDRACVRFAAADEVGCGRVGEVRAVRKEC